MPNDTPTTTPDFSAIQGHQIHDDSTMSAPEPYMKGVAERFANKETDPVTELGRALDHVTSGIENYTQSGRELHPVLSHLGDVTREAKELFSGGQSAGKPMGTSSGVVNNPVTQVMSGAEAAPEAGEALEAGAKKIGNALTDTRAFHPNPEHGGVPLSFDHIPGHQMETPSGPSTQKELVHVAPKDFISKTNEGPVHTDTVNHYRERIRAGEDVGPASITYDASGNITGANGRHRALAHMQEGTERMPVEIHRPIEEAPKKFILSRSESAHPEFQGSPPGSPAYKLIHEDFYPKAKAGNKEALQSLQKMASGQDEQDAFEAQRVLKNLTTPDYQFAAEKAGVEFRGVQEGIEGKHPGLAIFQDPKSGTSVAVKLDQWSPEKLQEHIDLARERMKPQVKPNPAGAGTMVGKALSK